MPAKRQKPELIIVAIGASAGGLDASTKLITALPGHTGMAYILVQHLDPDHDSMMAELLGGHTAMTVEQAIDGATITANHLYIIPPGSYLAVADGKLHLSKPNAKHGARLPFDFLLQSLTQMTQQYMLYPSQMAYAQLRIQQLV